MFSGLHFFHLVYCLFRKSDAVIELIFFTLSVAGSVHFKMSLYGK